MYFKKIIRLIYYSIIVFSLVFIFITVKFLYTNFYQTLSGTQEIHFLKNEVSFETVDMDLWNHAIQEFENKKVSRLKKDEDLADPFRPFIEINSKR